MLLTEPRLRAILPLSGAKAALFLPALRNALAAYAIDTPLRAAAFLAQAAVESGELRYVREIWGPTSAQRGYEGRMDLGNTQTGDGYRFRGRGLIQITGRANYAVCGDALGLDLIARPELLEQPEAAALSAAWYWNSRALNAYADRGDLESITRRINGGLNGYAERLRYYVAAKAALGCA